MAHQSSVMGAIGLYAELLLNIRQVTVFATLPTIFDGETQITLSNDRRSLVVTHNGERAVLDLPCQTISSAAILLPAIETKELCFRLPVANDDRAKEIRGTSHSNVTIWPASALSPTTQVACRSCKNIFVKDKITTWKDLPSDNWAEMMDFWHCHKPHVRDDTYGAEAPTKDYPALNGYLSKPGVAFVDDSHLRLSASDCIGLEVSSARADHIFYYVVFIHYVRTGNKKEACLHVTLDPWHNRRYNCPRENPIINSASFSR